MAVSGLGCGNALAGKWVGHLEQSSGLVGPPFFLLSPDRQFLDES